MLLPKNLKVDYKRAVTSAENGWFAWLLWEMITPGWTAVFLIITALFFYNKASQAETDREKSAYKEAGFSLLSWGLINGLVYVLIVAKQQSPMKKRA